MMECRICGEECTKVLCPMCLKREENNRKIMKEQAHATCYTKKDHLKSWGIDEKDTGSDKSDDKADAE